ncbi:hypothetical protein [Actinoplanes sp. N902-109]|uniref:hypothetical protein n=1 Tax=Actinoplanes sp. (strain N902-109) TaxID=649831 RepID=UPI00032961C9|nr:hypothetical protein [Actinoplanes sp. N902-109]AGL13622.1 hypothetical protein L083_0112 [Actinoplanes sp. N902-109]
MSYAVQPPAPTPAPRPTTVGLASLLLLIMAVAGLGYAVATVVIAPGTVSRFRDVAGSTSDTDNYVTVIWIGAATGAVVAILLFALYVVLALGLRRGSNGVRIATLVVCTLGLLAGCASTAAVALQRARDHDPGTLGAALADAYPGAWIPLNLGVSIAQMVGYVLVGVLLLTSPRSFFGRAPQAPAGYGGAPGYGPPPAVPGYGPPPGGPGYGQPGYPAGGYAPPGPGSGYAAPGPDGGYAAAGPGGGYGTPGPGPTYGAPYPSPSPAEGEPSPWAPPRPMAPAGPEPQAVQPNSFGIADQAAPEGQSKEIPRPLAGNDQEGEWGATSVTPAAGEAAAAIPASSRSYAPENSGGQQADQPVTAERDATGDATAVPSSMSAPEQPHDQAVPHRADESAPQGGSEERPSS